MNMLGKSLKVVNAVGGLGSQMMAYALAESLKEKQQHSHLVTCDFSAYHLFGRKDHNGSELTRAFELQEDCVHPVLAKVLHSKGIAWRVARKALTKSGILNYHGSNWRTYNYDHTVFDLRPGITIYNNQSWTSWKYFHHIRNTILDVFRF